MNDSGSGYQGATGMLDAEAEGWALCCNASNMSNVCTFSPLTYGFDMNWRFPWAEGLLWIIEEASVPTYLLSQIE